MSEPGWPMCLDPTLRTYPTLDAVALSSDAILSVQNTITSNYDSKNVRFGLIYENIPRGLADYVAWTILRIRRSTPNPCERRTRGNSVMELLYNLRLLTLVQYYGRAREGVGGTVYLGFRMYLEICRNFRLMHFLAPRISGSNYSALLVLADRLSRARRDHISQAAFRIPSFDWQVSAVNRHSEGDCCVPY
jgi:hypothetical protein